MSILESYLAIEKEKDGKPFIVCDVGTWFYLGVSPKEHQEKDAKRLYNLFDKGKDKSERPITFNELKKLESNGGICIIPKEKDVFVNVLNWEDYAEKRR